MVLSNFVLRQTQLMVLMGLLLNISSSFAETLRLSASQDNTLYETEADGGMNTITERSNGQGDYLFAGRVGFDGNWKRRRAVLAFDIAGAVPAGAIITYAELQLYMSNAPPNTVPIGLNLHRMTADWGEGISNALGPEGQGAPPATDDATWHQRFYGRAPAALWTTPGAEGDYSSTVSSSAVIGTQEETYKWPCRRELIDDVQLWLETPAANFGWIVLGDAGGFSARRFNSRESGQKLGISGSPPQLLIAYQTANSIFNDDFDPKLTCSE